MLEYILTMDNFDAYTEARFEIGFKMVRQYFRSASITQRLYKQKYIKIGFTQCLQQYPGTIHAGISVVVLYIDVFGPERSPIYSDNYIFASSYVNETHIIDSVSYKLSRNGQTAYLYILD